MKLTVGIPTFNRAEMLAETIESVLAQTFEDFRVIVSDNASQDHTAEVVRSFRDERIVYRRSERNVGPIANQNRLIGLTDTDFLVLLPDDDILYPGHLEAVVEVLERWETVGLVHSAFNVIDAQSRVVRSVHPLAADSLVTIEHRDRALERIMVSNWPICFSSVAYRTQAIVEAGGFRPHEGHFGDLQLWMRIALGWDFGYVAEPLAGFRNHAAAASQTLGAQEAVASDGREIFRRHAQMRYERRMDFLDHAALDARRAEALRARATLRLLAEHAALGLPGNELAMRLADLVRSHPRLLLHPALWRLLGAQSGGRRVRTALAQRAASRAGRRTLVARAASAIAGLARAG